MRFGAIVAAIAAGIGSAAANPLAEFNGIILNNFNAASDVEGRLLVGGNLTGAGTLAKNLAPGAFDSVLVAGNINGNFNAQAGNLRLSGSRNGSFNFNGGGSQINDPTLPAFVDSVEAQLRASSSFLAGLAATGTVVAPVGQPAGVTFNAVPGAGGVAVFNIDAALLSSNLVQNFNINLNGAAAVIINVSGSAVSINGGNFDGNFTNALGRTGVLWNFYEATTLDINRGFGGSILALDAHLTGNSPIDGAVAVGSADYRGEFHIAPFGGPFLVPSPATAGLLAMGGLAAARRRRG